jgi:hypothetical protein
VHLVGSEILVRYMCLVGHCGREDVMRALFGCSNTIRGRKEFLCKMWLNENEEVAKWKY